MLPVEHMELHLSIYLSIFFLVYTICIYKFFFVENKKKLVHLFNTNLKTLISLYTKNKELYILQNKYYFVQ